ncbi:MAG: hypothetical protein VX938_01160, partial [Myxococcota bacterium]|nr:hypothetical protein [Myxococcota bacterium]
EIAKTAEPGRSVRVGEQRHRAVVQRAVRSFDPDWGGLRGRMKFPTPIRWRYLLRSWRKWGGDELEAGLKRTLDQMAAGGIHDQLGGGFHRYTTEKTWLVPHFEKMLYDNAQITELFLEASAAFDSPTYLEVARKTMDYMLKEMYEEGGGFYASYDADSGGEEGTFYVWKPQELVAIAGGEDGKILARLLGVTPGGNFEHQTSILTWRTSFEEVATSTGHPVSRVREAGKKWQPVMYDVRAKRVWPGLDKKIVTSWNGLAIGAMARGYAATSDVRYLKAATDTSDYLWRVHRKKDGGLYRASNQGKPLERGVLDDYAFLAAGLLDLFEVTGDLETLARVRELLSQADRRFSRESGGWYMAENSDQSLVLRPFDTYDAVRPSGNSRLLDAHLRLAALAGDTKGFATVQRSLGAYGQLAGQSGLGMAGWLDVALLHEGPFYEVVIAGDPQNAGTAALRQVWKEMSPPWAVRVDVPSKGPTAAQVKALPAVDAKRGKDGGPLAYVCVRGSCKMPTSDPATFRSQLQAGWSH